MSILGDETLRSAREDLDKGTSSEPKKEVEVEVRPRTSVLYRIVAQPVQCCP